QLNFPLVRVWLLTGEAPLLPSTVLLNTSERQLNRPCSSASCSCLAVGTAEMGKTGGKCFAHPPSVSDASGTLTITAGAASLVSSQRVPPAKSFPRMNSTPGTGRDAHTPTTTWPVTKPEESWT